VPSDAKGLAFGTMQAAPDRLGLETRIAALKPTSSARSPSVSLRSRLASGSSFAITLSAAPVPAY
jgi:hypothetical protein